MRKVLPISMILTLALFGCTLNRTPGDGQPVTTTPNMSPASTPGSSYGTNPSMSSSYAEPANANVSRADQAAAIMREHQAYQPRFLGYLNPEPRAPQAVPQYPDTGGQFVNPSLSANPQITVNSSISSGPYPVITGGSDGFVVAGPTGNVVAGGTGTTGTATATVAPSTVGTVGTAGTTATPTSNAPTLTPTITSGATVSPTLAASPLTPMTSASGGTVLTTGAGTVPVGTTGRTMTTTTGVRTGTAALTVPGAGVTPLNVTTTPGGQIMITNVRR